MNHSRIRYFLRYDERCLRLIECENSQQRRKFAYNSETEENENLIWRFYTVYSYIQNW